MSEKIPKIDEIIENVHNKPENNISNQNNEHIEQLIKLEFGKIIIEKSLDITNIKSMTFLNAEHIDDILSAKILNKYFNVPEIDKYIKDFMLLKRSEGGVLIKLFSQIAMSMRNDNDDGMFKQKSFFDRILRR